MPVVGTELSVTVAVIVCVPAEVGCHVIENGDVPPTVPILAPFTKNCTDERLAPVVGLAVAVMEMPAGDVIDATVEPELGLVIEIVGVARATEAESPRMLA